MNKNFSRIILVSIILGILFFVGMDASAQTVDELREDGTLLMLFVAAIVGGFYVFCVALTLLADTGEKKLTANQNTRKIRRAKPRPRPRPQTAPRPRPTATYSIPQARAYMAQNHNINHKKYAQQ